ncbi:MAG: hypothetical protein HKN76_10810 [Saprospiraceae bacterium]|nr:hypothetical protein [Saprospiraceae bacterium]
MTERLSSRWYSFQEQAWKVYPYFRKFGFYLDSITYGRVANTNTWRFKALYRNSKRVVDLSLITAIDQEGAVSLFITKDPENNNKSASINLYKYLRKNFSMLNRKSLFLSRNSGDFSHRLQKVFRSYARFSQFYMVSILRGIKWDD